MSAQVEQASAKFKQAWTLHRGGATAEAERLYHEVLALDPAYIGALHQLAGLALEAGRALEGAEFIGRAIALNPEVAQTHANLGFALSLLKRFDEALSSYDRAIVLNPAFAEAHYSRGVVLSELGRHEDAVASYDNAVRLKNDYAQAYVNRGIALYDLERFTEALSSYDDALAARPGDPNIHYNRGNALSALKRLDEALASYNKAIALKPDHIVAYNNRGIVLTGLKRHGEAVASFDKAISLAPGYVEAHNNRGVALNDMKSFEEAFASYDRAIALDPDFAEAHYGRGVTLNELKRSEEALASYESAYALAPDSPFLLGKLIHMKMAICDWTNLEARKAALVEAIARGERVSPAFHVLPIADDPALQRQTAELYAAATEPLGAPLPKIVKRPRRTKIRLGYFSADLHDHATAVLMAELFERHDRKRFELTAFSFGPHTEDPMRKRLRKAFDRFHDVRGRSDRQAALFARENGIDLAVDLKGYTGDERHNIFAHRAAPVQISYLGYPGTMGARFMDYILADGTLIGPEDRVHYAEKIVTLPHSYQPNDTKRAIAAKDFARADVGLPEQGFVFACFNNTYKITPDAFSRWMRILARVDGSVLWLLEDNQMAAVNLRKEAAARGIAPARLVFAPRVALPEHLARHRLADLFLDTLPYNAHTTASDALWAGLPVVTLMGAAFQGRVAASLVRAVGLPELVTSTPEAYEGLAVDLATNPERLAALKAKLAANRLATPLFDIARFTRDIERAYVAMYDRYQSDLPPEHMDIPAAP
ncbi:MAG TPA: tetratricopeptide repeat protein [Rhizomicrobium sp.]|nr:tetratricopeptide repeat protein [Rhizomicrobium sp.]